MANKKAIAKQDIHVNRIKVLVPGAIQQEALFCLGNSSKGAKRRREFSSINPFTAFAD
jgi:hypothetical protein